MLKAEDTGKLLSREMNTDKSWNVGYGGDNCCWTITEAL